MSENKTHVIISPHPDDECIGCYEILLNKKKIIIIYTEDCDQNRREEAMELKNKANIDIKAQLFLKNVPPNLLNKDSVLYFPDPSYEIHPAHRKVGSQGEELLRKGLDVIFYNTIMNSPYIHEVEIPEQKEQLLNKVYPSQKSLWEYDKKYVLFEGYCSWIMKI